MRTRRFVRYVTQNSEPIILDALKILVKIMPRPGATPMLQDAYFKFTDGTSISYEGIKLQKKFEEISNKAKSQGITYAKIRLGDKDSTQYGYLSIEQDNSSSSLSINFKEYDYKHTNSFVSECLETMRQLDLHLCTQESVELRIIEILVLCIDIRGFSDFCSSPGAESKYIGNYLSVFNSAIRNCFVDTMENIIKSIGDGNLIIWSSNEVSLVETALIIIERLPILQTELRSIGLKEPFNIPVPTEIGCGFARGLAAEVPNDYFGRPINLAIRLCDQARPNGICVDSQVFRNYKPDPKLWIQEQITLKGFEQRSIWKRTFDDLNG